MRRISGVSNGVEEGGIGQGGNIKITAKEIETKEGARLKTFTLGEGNAGNINIQAPTISFQGGGYLDSEFQPSITLSDVEETGIGKAGNIVLGTDILSVTEGAQLKSNSFGNGDAGNITISANNSISFDGVSEKGETEESDKYSSGAFSRVENGGEGKSGSISINTEKLFIKNGAVLTTSTFGKQGAGNIDIKSKEVTVDGESRATLSSGIYSRILKRGAGQGGSIVIDTDNLSITNGGRLETSSSGNGDAGSIDIRSKKATVSGESPAASSSGIYSLVEESGKGQGGSIAINTDNLSVINGGRLETRC